MKSWNPSGVCALKRTTNQLMNTITATAVPSSPSQR